MSAINEENIQNDIAQNNINNMAKVSVVGEYFQLKGEGNTVQCPHTEVCVPPPIQRCKQNLPKYEQTIIAQFPKIGETHQLIRDTTPFIADGTFYQKMENVIAHYTNSVCEEFERANSSSLTCRKLASIIHRTSYLIHSISGALTSTQEFMNCIYTVTSYYIACELCAALDRTEPISELIKRIINEIDEYIMCNDAKVCKDNLMLIFVAIPDTFEQREIVCQLFNIYITQPHVVIQEELPDKMYIQYVIVFYQWLRLEVDGAAKDKLIDFADKFMRPAATLATNKKYIIHLPVYAARRTATRFILENISYVAFLQLRYASLMDNKLICADYPVYARVSTSNLSSINARRQPIAQTSVDSMVTTCDSYDGDDLLVKTGKISTERTGTLFASNETLQNTIEIKTSPSSKELNYNLSACIPFQGIYPNLRTQTNSFITNHHQQQQPTSNEVTIISNIQVTTRTPLETQTYACMHDSVQLVSTLKDNCDVKTLSNLVDNAVQTDAIDVFYMLGGGLQNQSSASNTAASCTSSSSTRVLYVQPDKFLHSSETSNSVMPYCAANEFKRISSGSDDMNSEKNILSDKKLQTEHIASMQMLIKPNCSFATNIKTVENQKQQGHTAFSNNVTISKTTTAKNNMDNVETNEQAQRNMLFTQFESFCKRQKLNKKLTEDISRLLLTKSNESTILDESSACILPSTVPIACRTSSTMLTSTSALWMDPAESSPTLPSSSITDIIKTKQQYHNERQAKHMTSFCLQNFSRFSKQDLSTQYYEFLRQQREDAKIRKLVHEKRRQLAFEEEQKRLMAQKRKQERFKRRQQEFAEEQKRLMAVVLADCKRAAEEASKEKLANNGQGQRRKSVDCQKIKAAVKHRENLKNINKILKDEAETMEKQFQIVKNYVGYGIRLHKMNAAKMKNVRECNTATPAFAAEQCNSTKETDTAMSKAARWLEDEVLLTKLKVKVKNMLMSQELKQQNNNNNYVRSKVPEITEVKQNVTEVVDTQTHEPVPIMQSEGVQTELDDEITTNNLETVANFEMAEKETQTNISDLYEHLSMEVIGRSKAKKSENTGKQKASVHTKKKKKLKKMSLKRSKKLKTVQAPTVNETDNTNSQNSERDTLTTTISLTKLASRAAVCQAQVDSILQQKQQQQYVDNSVTFVDSATRAPPPAAVASPIKIKKSHYKKYKNSGTQETNASNCSYETLKERYFTTTKQTYAQGITSFSFQAPVSLFKEGYHSINDNQDTAYVCLDKNRIYDLRRRKSGGDCQDNTDYDAAPIIGRPKPDTRYIRYPLVSNNQRRANFNKTNTSTTIYHDLGLIDRCSDAEPDTELPTYNPRNQKAKHTHSVMVTTSWLR